MRFDDKDTLIFRNLQEIMLEKRCPVLIVSDEEYARWLPDYPAFLGE